MGLAPKRNGLALDRPRPLLRLIWCAGATARDPHAAFGVRPTHWACELRREVHKLIQLRREVRKRGWFRIHMRREVHELSQRGPRRMSVGV